MSNAYLNIIAIESIVASGLAAPFPAMSGALPWIGAALGAGLGGEFGDRFVGWFGPRWGLRLIPLDDTVVFPNMTVTLGVDVGDGVGGPTYSNAAIVSRTSRSPSYFVRS